MNITKKLAQKRSRAGRWCWALYRERQLDFFCFSCFPMAELRTFVFVTLFCIAVGTAVAWCTVVAAQFRTDIAVTSCCSGGGPRQPWSSGLAPVSRFHSSVPLSHSSPSLIGHLASVDVKQQKFTSRGAYGDVHWGFWGLHLTSG